MTTITTPRADKWGGFGGEEFGFGGEFGFGFGGGFGGDEFGFGGFPCF